MNQEITLTFSISEEEYLSFFRHHYSSYRMLKFRPYYGAVMAAYGLSRLIQNEAYMILSLLLVSFGIYFLFSMKMLLAKAIRAYRSNPKHGETMHVRISDEALEGAGEGFSFKQTWDRFIGYRESKEGYLLYGQKNFFFIIPKKVLDDEKIRFMKQVFSDHGVKGI